MPAIVYLKAKGIGAYRSHLRSDTLWGAICWNIRELFGDVALQQTLGEYPAGEGAFFLSSAFPWVKSAKYGLTHFLPHPMLQPPLSETVPDAILDDSAKVKAHFRARKKEESTRKGYISWQQFAYRFGDDQPTIPNVKVKIDSRAVTRNQIDRSRLGVLTENESGQLFHMNENFVTYELEQGDHAEASGLYFLLEGDTSRVFPALRLLESLGVGGDRTVGKGQFEVRWEEDVHNLGAGAFSLPKVVNPNAQVNLSVYNYGTPDKLTVLKAYETAGNDAWQYKLDVRQGRTAMQHDFQQASKLLFAEGSVFPMAATGAHPGANWEAGSHKLRQHKVHRYGHAFMLDIRLK